MFEKASISDIQFVGDLDNNPQNVCPDNSGDKTYIIVLQNYGAFHLCHPNSNTVLQKTFIQSYCFNANFSISSNVHKNLNGILVANEKGTIAETYIFHRYHDNQALGRRTVLTRMKTAMK